MVRRAETGRVVMLSVTPRRLISLPLSCLVTVLVSSSGFDALWEIIGAETNVSRHLFVCRVNTSMQRQNISVSTQHTKLCAEKLLRPTHHWLKSVSPARGSMTYSSFLGENTATDDPFDHLFNSANTYLVVRVEMEQIIEITWPSYGLFDLLVLESIVKKFAWNMTNGLS